MLGGAGIMFAGIVLGYAMREASEPDETDNLRRALSDVQERMTRASDIATSGSTHIGTFAPFDPMPHT